jgi:phage-related protein
MEGSRKWTVVYYEDRREYSQVYDFIESRSEREKAKILAWLDLLETQGPQLPRPYADLLEDGIHELRVRLSGENIRMLYFFCFKDYIILSNCFDKTTGKVPRRELETARKNRRDFLLRYNEKNIKEALDENV